jgi:hypothetical protein
MNGYGVREIYEMTIKASSYICYLEELQIGCKKHRAYRAIRKGTANCTRCGNLWFYAQRCKQLRKEIA